MNGTDCFTPKEIKKEVIEDARLEAFMQDVCSCENKDVNFWYIKDDKDRKYIHCRGCQTVVSSLK